GLLALGVRPPREVGDEEADAGEEGDQEPDGGGLLRAPLLLLAVLVRLLRGVGPRVLAAGFLRAGDDRLALGGGRRPDDPVVGAAGGSGGGGVVVISHGLAASR